MTTTTESWENDTGDSNFTNFGHPLASVPNDDTGRSIVVAYVYYYLIIDAVLLLPTIFGNSLILVSFVRFRPLRKHTSFIMIGNLAVSDLLVGLVLIPMDMVLLETELKIGGWAFCVVHYCVSTTLIAASVLNFFLMSVERFHAIVWPLQHKARFTRRVVYIMISVAWTFVSVLGFLPLMTLWEYPEVDDQPGCRTDIVISAYYRLVVNILLIASIVTNTVFFVIIVRIALSKVDSSKYAVNPSSLAHKNPKDLKREIRHTKLMLLVSGLFAICWGPYCIVSLIPEFSPYVLLVRSWCFSLGFINSCLNWIVYGIRNRRIRKAFRLVLTCSGSSEDLADSSDASVRTPCNPA